MSSHTFYQFRVLPLRVLVKISMPSNLSRESEIYHCSQKIDLSHIIYNRRIYRAIFVVPKFVPKDKYTVPRHSERALHEELIANAAFYVLRGQGERRRQVQGIFQRTN